MASLDTELWLSDPWLICIGAMLVAASCSLTGYYLTLRKQSLFGDALSHSLLPGLLLAFFISGSLGGFPMLLGALFAGLLSSYFIERIRRQKHIQEDTSMGVVFTTMFAFGVLMLSLFAKDVHLDTQCVLFGELLFLPLSPTTVLAGAEIPISIVQLAGGFLFLCLICFLLHKEFLLLAFHEQMAKSLGLPVRSLHYLLMALASLAIVLSFELVGAILVIGFLILPPSIGKLLFSTFRGIYLCGLVASAISIAIAVPAAFKWNLNPASLIVLILFLEFTTIFTVKFIRSQMNLGDYKRAFESSKTWSRP